MTPTKLPIVMLVDDELSVLDALERDLKKRFTCVKCQTFQQAKDALNSPLDIRVLVTDEVLGSEGSGLDLLHWAQQSSPLVVRCLISGKMETEKITEALGKGLYHRFFFKPWDPKALELQLTECLLMADLLKESKLDPLTGLLNRRGFEEQLTREIEGSLRHGRKISLILWDLDHFKNINDVDGHGAGDECLRHFAAHLQQCLRGIDYVSRLGGDEFAVILPDTGQHMALQIAERIHRAMKNKVTASGGVVEFHPESDSIKTFMDRADQALYRAKNSGRNQVQVQD
jgi:diguanylate cyclase (GGDEF)-like protein